MRFASAALPIVFCALIAGCAQVDGKGIYATKTIGNVNRSVTATVMLAEPISIRDAGAGGAAYGGLVGGGLASGSDDAGIVLIGILAGAIVGELVEESANTHAATKYTLRTSNGAILVVAKINDAKDRFDVGDAVNVIYGSPNRLVKTAQ